MQNGKLSISMKSSLLSGRPPLTLSDINTGDVVKGTIKTIEVYGLFIRIRNSSLIGFCHKTEVCFASSLRLTRLGFGLNASQAQSNFSPWR